MTHLINGEHGWLNVFRLANYRIAPNIFGMYLHKKRQRIPALPISHQNLFFKWHGWEAVLVVQVACGIA